MTFAERRNLNEWRTGWKTVAAAALGYGTGGPIIMLSAGLFIRPMREALGWSTTQVTFAPIVSLVIALCLPMAGVAIDRFGGRRVAILGSLALVGSVVLFAVAPITHVSIYLLAIIMGVSCSMTMVPTYTRVVAGWFDRERGAAFGLTLSGSALVAIVSVPATGMAIEHFGWRGGFWAIAATIVVIGIPAILAGLAEREPSEEPREAGSGSRLQGMTAAVALRDGRFWAYLMALTVGCVPLGGMVAHLQPLLADQGFSLRSAITLGVVYALSISFGRIVGGILLDRFWPFAVASGILLVTAAASFGVARIDDATATPLVFLIVWGLGVAQGAEADFLAFFCARSFGLRAYSTIVGVMSMSATVGIAAGGIWYGMMFDAFSDYRVACNISSLLFILSAMIILAVGIYEARGARLNRGRAALAK